MTRHTPAFFVSLVMICAACLCQAQDLAAFEKRTTAKVLENGLTVILCERHEAPVFSFFTLVDVGDADDPMGQSGMAHMLEHMAFKGSDRIGSTNYAEEKIALQQVEQAYLAYDREARKEPASDPRKLAGLKTGFDKAVDKANGYVIRNRFGEIVESEGGVGIDARTSLDSTQYFYSFPVNRLEVWAYLESERFRHPVFREFYKERQVVQEERRLRIDSNPIGRMVEEFLAAAYIAHPYGRSGIGWPSELDHLTASEAEVFFRKYYVPGNMVITLVGDLKPAQVFPVVEKYFGRLPAVSQPEAIRTIEPRQSAERTVVLRENSQPLYLEGYHRPSYRDPDDAVYEVISDLLSQGRTSRLYRALVKDKRVATRTSGFSGFPGDKYPNLFAFFAIPVPPHTPAELAQAIHQEIETLKSQDVSDEELQMVKIRAKADLIRRLGGNQGLAEQLAFYASRYGDWRELFRSVDRIDRVTKADIRRIANKTFAPGNRTVAMIQSTSAQEKPEARAANKEPCK